MSIEGMEKREWNKKGINEGVFVYIPIYKKKKTKMWCLNYFFEYLTLTLLIILS